MNPRESPSHSNCSTLRRRVHLLSDTKHLPFRPCTTQIVIYGVQMRNFAPLFYFESETLLCDCFFLESMTKFEFQKCRFGFRFLHREVTF